MIRLVLAVVLTSALFGVALPSVERADQERSAALALDELERVAATSERLAAENDPTDPGETPATATVTVEMPDSVFAEDGRIRLRNDELRWVPPSGPDRIVDLSVPFRVETPIIASDRVSIRLSLVRLDGRVVVFATRTVGDTDSSRPNVANRLNRSRDTDRSRRSSGPGRSPNRSPDTRSRRG